MVWAAGLCSRAIIPSRDSKVMAVCPTLGTVGDTVDQGEGVVVDVEEDVEVTIEVAIETREMSEIGPTVITGSGPTAINHKQYQYHQHLHLRRLGHHRTNEFFFFLFS